MSENVWTPPDQLRESSNVAQFMAEYGYEYEDLVPDSEAELERIWADFAEDVGVVWEEPYDEVVDTSDGVEFATWFPGGKLNAVETVLDQWVERTPDRPMYVWEDEQGNSASITYAEMAARTNRMANALREHGIGRGDVVGIIFPMHPNAFAATMACLRVGAVFTPIFPGYGAEAMAHRLEDAGAELLVVADGYQRNGSTNDLLSKVNDFIGETPALDEVVVYRHVGVDTEVPDATIHEWAEFVSGQDDDAESAIVDAQHPAFIAYSSGTTGKPKGTIQNHVSFLVNGNKEARHHFDVGEGDTLMWVTDFGWVVVPIWMVAGAPALGGTVVLLEGGPMHPDEDRIWQAIEQYEVNAFGIAPTGARTLRQHDEAPRERHDLSSLRVLGSTGEPWDDESWRWFLNAVGGGDAPIINVSGGTELAGAIVGPTPVTPLKPNTLYGPVPGIAGNIYDEDGNPADEGYLVVEQPSIGMTKSLTSGDERYLEEYWTDFDGVWNQNDWAERDEDGFWFITGRADDTMNVAGRRVTAPAIEEVILDHPAVDEASVVPVPDEVKGQAPAAFVSLVEGADVSADELESEIVDHVAENLSGAFRPASVHILSSMPRTQTGKIPRGVIESTHLEDDPGNVSTLQNADVIDEIPRRDRD